MRTPSPEPMHISPRPHVFVPPLVWAGLSEADQDALLGDFPESSFHTPSPRDLPPTPAAPRGVRPRSPQAAEAPPTTGRSVRRRLYGPRVPELALGAPPPQMSLEGHRIDALKDAPLLALGCLERFSQSAAARDENALDVVQKLATYLVAEPRFEVRLHLTEILQRWVRDEMAADGRGWKDPQVPGSAASLLHTALILLPKMPCETSENLFEEVVARHPKPLVNHFTTRHLGQTGLVALRSTH